MIGVTFNRLPGIVFVIIVSVLAVEVRAGATRPDMGQAQESVSGPAVLSASDFYREFRDNPLDATDRYGRRAVVLEGPRGEMILMSDGVQAAVHIAEGARTNALILTFSDRNQLRGIGQGQRFRARCTVHEYKYSTIWLEDCSVETSAPRNPDAGAAGAISTAGSNLLSANALYREFQDNEVDAARRHAGRMVTLEGLRGEVIATSGGAAAVHIADRYKSNALILSFPDGSQIRSLERGQRFRFRCTLSEYKYLSLWLDGCSIDR